jgi:hypothetical protein
VCYIVTHSVRLPDLEFSEYFYDHNHEHNVDEFDVLDAIIGRRIVVSRQYVRDGKPRRRIICKGDSEYLTVVCQPAEDFWWVLSAYPCGASDERRGRDARVGEET